MARQQLQGTVEEQAAQLYDMAVEAMQEGRYSGAYRYFLEIERALPGFRDVPEQLKKARQARQEQRTLLMSSLLGAMLLIVLARVLGAQSELVFLGAGILGLALGFIVSFMLTGSRRKRANPTSGD